ncbi:MAG: extracellular solute-binding protein [Kiritimatiellae bacterium]|nr:extracellular solute-binding protein [Kiritimatiellia bacterium]
MRRRRPTEAFERAIRSSIERGELKPGEMVLSLSAICGQYGLKRSTAQKALIRLAQAGYLKTVHGSGTFVSGAYGAKQLRVYVYWPSPVRPYLEAVVAKRPDRAVLIDDRETADVICSAVPDTQMANSPVPLDPWLGDDPLAGAGAWIPRARERYGVEGRTYALLVYGSPVLIFYNRELFEKARVQPPADRWNWGEFKEAVHKLRPLCDTENAGVIPFHKPFCYYAPFLAQNEAHIFSPGGQCKLAAPEALEAVAYLRELRRLSGGDLVEGRQYAERFLSGRSAMVLWSSALIGRLAREAPFEWGWMPLPEHKVRAGGMHSEGLHIGAGSTRKDEAWAFIKACVSDSAQRELVSQGLAFPARANAAGEFVRRHGAEYKRMLAEMNIGVGEEYRFGAPVLRVLNRSMRRVLDPDVTEEAAFGMCRETARVLDSMIQAERDEELREIVA